MKFNFKALNLFARLDVEIVCQAVNDLKIVDSRNCIQAALYFFLDGVGVDERYPKTFTHLCARNGIDPDTAAKAIWNQLTEIQQNRVLYLLKEAGFSTTKVN